jgi:hypothetical protein
MKKLLNTIIFISSNTAHLKNNNMWYKTKVLIQKNSQHKNGHFVYKKIVCKFSNLKLNCIAHRWRKQ